MKYRSLYIYLHYCPFAEPTTTMAEPRVTRHGCPFPFDAITVSPYYMRVSVPNAST